MNKKLIIPVVAAALLGISILGVNQVSAQGNVDGRNTLVEKIATTFGLNQTDVQSVFDTHRSEMQTQMQAKFAERLTEKVTDGTITEAQKQLMLQKHQEMQSKMAQLKDLEPEARRQAMQQYHEELKTWAESNGINVRELLGGFGRGFNKGFRAGYQMGNQ